MVEALPEGGRPLELVLDTRDLAVHAVEQLPAAAAPASGGADAAAAATAAAAAASGPVPLTFKLDEKHKVRGGRPLCGTLYTEAIRDTDNWEQQLQVGGWAAAKALENDAEWPPWQHHFPAPQIPHMLGSSPCRSEVTHGGYPTCWVSSGWGFHSCLTCQLLQWVATPIPCPTTNASSC